MGASRSRIVAWCVQSKSGNRWHLISAHTTRSYARNSMKGMRRVYEEVYNERAQFRVMAYMPEITEED